MLNRLTSYRFWTIFSMNVLRSINSKPLHLETKLPRLIGLFCKCNYRIQNVKYFIQVHYIFPQICSIMTPRSIHQRTEILYIIFRTVVRTVGKIYFPISYPLSISNFLCLSGSTNNSFKQDQVHLDLISRSVHINEQSKKYFHFRDIRLKIGMWNCSRINFLQKSAGSVQKFLAIQNYVKGTNWDWKLSLISVRYLLRINFIKIRKYISRSKQVR